MRPIHGENPIQVINFMLEELGPITLEIDFVELAPEILVADPDPVGSLHPDQEVREGKTVVPHREIFGADVDDFGVDQGPRTVHLDVNNPDRGPDLGGCDTAAGAETGLPIAERIAEVVDDHPDGRRAWLGNRLTSGPKHRVSKEANSVNSHASNLGDRRFLARGHKVVVGTTIELDSGDPPLKRGPRVFV